MPASPALFCTRAFIGLGANLGQPGLTLKSAVHALRKLPDSHLKAISSLYRSTPLGPAGQPDYLNAVVWLETALPPHTLLAALQAIESAHGRLREIHWGARTLDLDVLLYGNDVIATSDLTVPHPELKNRNFVLIPLLELQADLRLTYAMPLSSLPAARDHHGIELIASHWTD
ncbi:MAG: 2-amino-4-hydroxy-6-hydroxymethyldihydropteridine diphosphokinase [bacterium]|nr:2-amino-4-hydroxy-6-hydroxymethyldihydropteridine diphosphokinase [bacterium]